MEDRALLVSQIIMVLFFIVLVGGFIMNLMDNYGVFKKPIFFISWVTLSVLLLLAVLIVPAFFR